MQLLFYLGKRLTYCSRQPEQYRHKQEIYIRRYNALVMIRVYDSYDEMES